MLGLYWFTENDSFKYNFTDIIKTHFYDQLGMISPIILQFRLIFSRCLHKYDWNTELKPMHV